MVCQSKNQLTTNFNRRWSCLVWLIQDQLRLFFFSFLSKVIVFHSDSDRMFVVSRFVCSVSQHSGNFPRDFCHLQHLFMLLIIHHHISISSRGASSCIHVGWIGNSLFRTPTHAHPSSTIEDFDLLINKSSTSIWKSASTRMYCIPYQYICS